ncbi:MAG: TonB family protein [Shinella sp.]|nr:TonB family protein [Shinella sp.]
MVGSRLIWGGAIVLSLLAHAGAAAILTMTPAEEQEEALIAGGVVTEVAMLGNGAFEEIETGNPDEVIRPEEIQPEEVEPVQPETAEIVPQEVEPMPVEPLDVQPVPPEPVEAMEVPGSEVEIAAIPIPEIKPEIQPEEKAETVQPVPEKKEPVKKAERRKKKVAQKAGEEGRNRQSARKGQVDGVEGVKSASLGGEKRGNSSVAGNAAVSNYPGKVRNKINRAKRRAPGSGSVVVSFVVSSGGQASGIRIARSSGDSDLDQAAVDSVRRASPFPKIPEAAGRNSWPFSVPIVFK